MSKDKKVPQGNTNRLVQVPSTLKKVDFSSPTPDQLPNLDPLPNLMLKSPAELFKNVLTPPEILFNKDKKK